MPRERVKETKSFALRKTLLAEIRECAEKSGIVGGQSWIVDDAVDLWMGRYRQDGTAWLDARGLPVRRAPKDDI